jgi:2-oxoglutarate ferredoxin oxidoreductase subunit alpha/2-oxoisovalerate ferredoxin oxidoreductase alpha subunit
VPLLVVEASEGQLEDELRLALSHGSFRVPPIDRLRHQGGVLPTAGEIVERGLDVTRAAEVVA